MDELYVLARRVLLDALEALEPYREAVVLVGAQAIYLHVGEADLAVASYTTDGDLILDPARLAHTPPLEDTLRRAGFVASSRDSVGSWIAHRTTLSERDVAVPIDLMVPQSVSSGSGRRSTRLPGHDPHVARRVAGLEGALVDADTRSVVSLEDRDDRSIDVRVAGPAALLVAKLHKIRDRRDSTRLSDKDALDVWRLLRGTSTHELAGRLKRLFTDVRSRDAARSALPWLHEMFGERRGLGIGMAQRAVGGLVDAAEVEASCLMLVADVLRAVES